MTDFIKISIWSNFLQVRRGIRQINNSADMPKGEGGDDSIPISSIGERLNRKRF